MDIYEASGLPKELWMDDTIIKESQQITVYIDKKKFGKSYTIISGFSKEIDMKSLLKKLKTKFACGGTIRDNKIELQGNHKKKVKDVLVEEGFNPDMITIR